ncbi:hypothetical protein [Brevundimonas sp.]|uniref:hypothetical protein n=1 Tax=Brevundimonas sp. TaxID=1871086 RepID=UPI0025BF7B31|nr:hypothetical protein [Brevundimonas sp.]
MSPPARDSSVRHRRAARRWGAAALSVLAHLAILFPVLSLRANFQPPPVPSPPLVVTLEPPPRPIPPPAPPTETPDPAPPAGPPVAAAAAPTPQPTRPPPLRLHPPRTPPPSAPLPAAEPAPEPPGISLLGANQTAGAAVAGPPGGGGGTGAGGQGSGAGGGRCDMVRRLQDALADDVEVRAAVRMAHDALSAQGRALLVWDGDWRQSRGEAGKGLAGLRQAVAVEVAFAPAACKDQPMRGLGGIDIHRIQIMAAAR